jgi:hypothetical protein
VVLRVDVDILRGAWNKEWECGRRALNWRVLKLPGRGTWIQPHLQKPLLCNHSPQRLEELTQGFNSLCCNPKLGTASYTACSSPINFVIISSLLPHLSMIRKLAELLKLYKLS